jgi:hypothetical protein
VSDPPLGASFAALAVAPPPAVELPEGLRGQAALVRAEADEALDHRVDLLGSGPTELGTEIDWHTDFKSGTTWPRAFYADLQVIGVGPGSDPKVPWDLSRGHQLLALARAAALFADERCAHELEQGLGSWIEANPPGVGINWVNAMEVAIRATNWAWALSTVSAYRAVDAELERKVVRSLQVHGRHIAANLEGTPYLRSNHFLADVLGLLVLGTVIDGDPQAQRWKRLALASLEREILLQVGEDGVGFEASLGYHGLALEIFLIGWWLADGSGSPLSPAYEARLRRMVEVSLAVRQPGGRTPAIGDADDGRVLPATSFRRSTHDPLLWAAAGLLGTPRPTDGEPSAEVAWNFGLQAWSRTGAAPPPPAPRSVAFRDGGVYVLATPGVHAVVRCGGVGQNGNGGHAHNDMLSYELTYDRPVVVDPGSYVYTADPVARNRFRSTASHSTVVVDGEEINPIVASELFRLRQVARPSLLRWEVDASMTSMVAAHDGYRRLDPAVVHERGFELDAASAELRISDRLTGRGTVTARCLVHLAPDTRPTAIGGHAFSLCDGAVKLEFSGDGIEVGIEPGEVSPSYGVRESAPVIVARVSGKLPLRFSHRFTRGHGG